MSPGELPSALPDHNRTLRSSRFIPSGFHVDFLWRLYVQRL